MMDELKIMDAELTTAALATNGAETHLEGPIGDGSVPAAVDQDSNLLRRRAARDG
jgi:hypothetical protein